MTYFTIYKYNIFCTKKLIIKNIIQNIIKNIYCIQLIKNNDHDKIQ